MHLLAGTSGFSYKEWVGEFYPDKLAAKDMLAHYATRLPIVEINNTFYRMPNATLIQGWRSQVPDSFRFAIKVPRRISHIKRLRDFRYAESAEEFELDNACPRGVQCDQLVESIIQRDIIHIRILGG